MIFLVLLVFCSFIVDPALAGDEQFVERWNQSDEYMQVFDRGLRSRKMIPMDFVSLTEYEGLVEPPVEAGQNIGRILLLYAQQNMTILLVTPKNSMKDMRFLNEEYRQARAKCAEDRSWIVLLPENAWTPVELNPYCSMDYGEEGIKLDLFWTAAARPLIDIVTSGLTCTSHYLYGWNRQEGRYELKSTKCTGRRIVEGYAESGSRLQQLF